MGQKKAYIQKMGQPTFTKILPTRKRLEIGKHAAIFLVLIFFVFLEFLLYINIQPSVVHIPALEFDDPKMLKNHCDREWMLRKIGILWHEYEPC